jgi:hypothetical protein
MEKMRMITWSRKIPFIITAGLVVVLLIQAVPAGAVTWKERPLLAWEKQVLEAFTVNNYDKVIAMAQGQTDDPNGNVSLLIYFSHAQKYYLEKDKASAVFYKQQYAPMLSRLSGANLAALTRLVAMPQTSWNGDVNGKFIKAAFEKPGNEQYLGAILFYLSSTTPEVSNGAVGGLCAILRGKREIVMNGGTLSREDREWMSDPMLLKLLIRKTGESVNPLSGFMSKLPAIARKKIMGGSAMCLALIEDPALPLLREAASMGNANAASTIGLVMDARGERLARYPNSTWYSAMGK